MHMPDPKLQKSLYAATKRGDIDLMIELISQGANILALTEEGEPIISYLAQNDVDKAQMRKFVKFITPYIYKESKP
jgi:hypothetical protein